jgi:hypothetical protein
MTAEEKIRFTIAEYCHRTDSGDFDGWAIEARQARNRGSAKPATPGSNL